MSTFESVAAVATAATHAANPEPATDLPQLSHAGGISTIRLNRPGSSNWLRDQDLRWLLATLAELHANPMVRVVVLTAQTGGQGRPVFCGGYEYIEAAKERYDPTLLDKVARALEGLRPITLCAMNGSCIGPALDLVLACDLRVAGAGAQLAMPLGMSGFNNRHTFVRAVKQLGMNGAKRLFLAGRPMGAEDPAVRGLFEAVPRPELFESYVGTLARQIAAMEPAALQIIKRKLTDAV
ncbi:enoyl-CoA hydratase/isomerase family protein [uncultured Pseudacidovorax sp.]|uniref:enoyl-CoA hydratase/isomerase family protein n=1 Tax=uncultured Pseudacidovorax sp. TaxID=679313 RepID=UPI0025D468A3|nr:enoyl-CoA hydratase/isomerase family protein [uncultured Pseudacidovorax sp.]